MPGSGTKRLGRLTRRPDFLRVARVRRLAVAPGVVLQAAPMPEGSGCPGPRIGLTASRRVGNAVIRNRARRRLRAAAQVVLLPRLGEPMDYVLIARSGTVSRGFTELVNDLETCVRRVSRERHR